MEPGSWWRACPETLLTAAGPLRSEETKMEESQHGGGIGQDSLRQKHSSSSLKLD